MQTNNKHKNENSNNNQDQDLLSKTLEENKSLKKQIQQLQEKYDKEIQDLKNQKQTLQNNYNQVKQSYKTLLQRNSTIENLNIVLADEKCQANRSLTTAAFINTALSHRIKALENDNWNQYINKVIALDKNSQLTQQHPQLPSPFQPPAFNANQQFPNQQPQYTQNYPHAHLNFQGVPQQPIQLPPNNQVDQQYVSPEQMNYPPQNQGNDQLYQPFTALEDDYINTQNLQQQQMQFPQGQVSQQSGLNPESFQPRPQQPSAKYNQYNFFAPQKSNNTSQETKQLQQNTSENILTNAQSLSSGLNFQDLNQTTSDVVNIFNDFDIESMGEHTENNENNGNSFS